jgi:putative NADH-flavin reductase
MNATQGAEMKLLVFGATGGTGRELVRQALERGHSVTAFARDPAALDKHDRLQSIAGDVLDAAAVERAVADHDAVLCTVGKPATSPGTVRSHGTRNIVRAMESAGPRRLICQSTIGIGDTRPLLPPRYKYLLVPLLLRRTFAEHERQEATVRSSQLDWTIVRAGVLTDGELTGSYRHGFPPTERSAECEISRADAAAFTLDLVANGAYLRQSPSLSY